MRESSDMYVKQEPKDDSLFVRQPKATGELHRSSAAADLPGDAQKAEKREPFQFSKWTLYSGIKTLREVGHYTHTHTIH